MIDVHKGNGHEQYPPTNIITHIVVDNVSIALDDEKTLQELFGGGYKEDLLIELEKKNRFDLIAKYIDPSRIDRWLFVRYNNHFYTQRMEYFLEHFKDFKKLCESGKLSKDFSLKLLGIKNRQYNGLKVVLDYPSSFEFYKNEPSEEIEPELAELGLKPPRNSPEKFTYRNYGKFQDKDIITKLISLCDNIEDLIKIKELSEIVRKVLEGTSEEDIRKDPYIIFLNNLANIGYAYAYTNGSLNDYVGEYKRFFNNVKEKINIKVAEILLQSNDESTIKFLDVFEKFSQDILSVMVASPRGWKYIKDIYESRDKSKIDRFKGLNFRKAVIDSLKYYFEFNRLWEIPWMQDTDNYKFSIELLDLGTDDKKVDFIKEYIESGLPYLKSFRNFNDRSSWRGFKCKIAVLIDYFGLKDNVEIQKVGRKLYDTERKAFEKK